MSTDELSMAKIEDVYKLLLDTKLDLGNKLISVQSNVRLLTTDIKDLRVEVVNVKHEITGLRTKVTGLENKFEHIDANVRVYGDRIAAVENDLDAHTKECEAALNSIPHDEFPVDLSLVCSGLEERADEDIYDKVQELVINGLGLVNTEIEKAIRLPSRDTNKPGLVKIKMFSKEDKVKALRCKLNLSDNGYRRVYLRSSMTHQERLMQQNFLTLLKEIPNGNKYRVTANGKVILKDVPTLMGTWTRGPPVTTNVNNE